MTKRQNVPVLILAGGLGTRISEETSVKPKPMIEIGDVPILIHIMRWYYSFGFDDFVICAGYKCWEIKNYFLNYEIRSNHLMIDHRKSVNQAHSAIGVNSEQEKWRVRVIDTGTDCMTGGRVARALEFVASQGDQFTDFALTYGDGLCDVNLGEELDFHCAKRRIGTVLGVTPSARFGELDLGPDGTVTGFLEKPESKQGSINGGFFFFKRAFGGYLKTDPACTLERDPLAKLSRDGQLIMYPHKGFWQPMDTLRDKIYLQGLWDGGKAPWAPRR